MTTVNAPRRPVSVTLPGYLLILVAVLAAIDGVAGLDTELIKRQIAAHTPGWVAPVQTTPAVAILLALGAVVVLIALPSSSGYIRSRRAAGSPVPSLR